jgi:hypothetical protein
MTLDGCGKPQVIADGLTVLITDGLPMRRPAVHESGSGPEPNERRRPLSSRCLGHSRHQTRPDRQRPDLVVSALTGETVT